MRCLHGLDASHRRLRTEQVPEVRRALKDALFLCHYGSPPCPWRPLVDVRPETLARCAEVVRAREQGLHL